MPSWSWRMPNRRRTCGGESRPCCQTTTRSRGKSLWPNSGREAGSWRSESRARRFTAPACNCEPVRLKDVEVLSTHDQILGGATGQEFLGCRFPAHRDYGWLIAGLGERIGSRLAAAGCHRSIRRRLRGRSPGRRVAPLRNRSQSAERWHHPPDAHTGSAHRR